MYKNNFVMALIANGNVLEEKDRKVRLPFGAEYKVRLINKAHKRCACDLVIDGEKIARFVINAGETSDIERYLDGNNYSGKKFTFASLHDPRVTDKNSFENGIVEAHFYLEKDPPPTPPPVEIHHHHDHYYPRPYYPKYPPDPYPIWTYCNSMDSISCKGMSTGYSADSMALNCCTSGGEIEGATVRGGESNQQFNNIYGLQFESNPTTLKLKIVNGEIQPTVRYCTGCGRKRKHGENYCSNCGTQL